jgi:hypothetical protein
MEASGTKGRPKNRCKDDVRKDWQTMKVKIGKKSVLNRGLWKTVVEQTKTHRVVVSVKKKEKKKKKKKKEKKKK